MGAKQLNANIGKCYQQQELDELASTLALNRKAAELASLCIGLSAGEYDPSNKFFFDPSDKSDPSGKTKKLTIRAEKSREYKRMPLKPHKLEAVPDEQIWVRLALASGGAWASIKKCSNHRLN